MVLIVSTAMAIATLVATVLLGRLAENWFIAFGLALVVLGAMVSMAQALSNAWRARKAKHVPFEDYLPKEETVKSSTFKYTGNIMGIDPRNPIAQLTKDIAETRRQTDQDIKRLEMLHDQNRHWINVCRAQIRYHEDVTLPSLLGAGTGHIIAAGVFTIWGSLYLAFPNESYERARYVSSIMSSWF